MKSDAQTIFLVENHDLMRDGLRAMFADSPWHVVGEADNGQDALRALEGCEPPDLLIVDLSMPIMPGTRFVELYRQTNRTTRILVLTAYAEEEYVYRALRAGANGYALKDSPMDELRHAIAVVLDGHGYLSPQICSGVIKGYINGNRDDSDISLLTPRERDVLHLVAEGMQNMQIANHLIISVKTVEKHKANLLRKLGMGSTAELREYLRTKDLKL
ncbi:response regulator [Desulfovibrio ferrophilus]|uniref:Two component transcriptional regulator, LuxR family n=1 Tax=Desulfovibrio ferrophilus TaxID=241368 RepID=A0A2Z6B3A8_9BACT|nr:response regulator transcription factor [Desulfovibrio ferrophilus]BBD09999.1 two component transcriptional regulator, LuxR family [Desulfovibrio ferrophilus]